jgi:hypothetical protein
VTASQRRSFRRRATLKAEQPTRCPRGRIEVRDLLHAAERQSFDDRHADRAIVLALSDPGLLCESLTSNVTRTLLLVGAGRLVLGQDRDVA